MSVVIAIAASLAEHGDLLEIFLGV